MSSCIKKLSPQEAQKIAAGEVVERPANVVKELIENALDAGATTITVYIEDGGKQLIRVVDNGCGMSLEDASLCFEHHATSKLVSVDDLVKIGTFGFRGEALSSIASVSSIVLLTKQAQDALGVKVELSQAIIMKKTAVACTTGTDLSVKNLFFNVPARKKFLKTRETEINRITQMLHAFCLNHISIDFVFFSDDKKIINCPAATSRSARIAQLYGSNYNHNLLSIASTRFTSGQLAIEGFISNHYYFKYDRNAIFLFINNRWIKNQQLVRALLRGYLNALPPARFPAAYIFISLDGGQVDINIHPRKEEVAFLHPRIVEQALTDLVKKQLENNMAQQISAPKKEALVFSEFQQKPSVFASSFAKQEEDPVKAFAWEESVSTGAQEKLYATEPFFKKPVISSVASVVLQNDSVASLPEVNQVLPIMASDTPLKILGQLYKTYIMIEKEDGLFLVDQHAAQERIFYENFLKQASSNIPSIRLLFPVAVSLSCDDGELLESYVEFFSQHGIELSIFGGQAMVQAAPVSIKHVAFAELLHEMLAVIKESDVLDSAILLKKMHEKLCAQMACKAAVKAGDVLTMQAMQQLLADLQITENRFTCPHGRPTGWLMSMHEIEKKFKRKA